VGDEVPSERLGDRDRPATGATLRGDEAGNVVPGVFDAEHPLLEVDVAPAERLQFTAAQAGVEGGGPECAVCIGQRSQQRLGLGGPGDAVALRTVGGEGEARVGFWTTTPWSSARR
jgi:hypothetical protein